MDKQKILAGIAEIRARLDAIEREVSGPQTADATPPPPDPQNPPEGGGGD